MLPQVVGVAIVEVSGEALAHLARRPARGVCCRLLARLRQRAGEPAPGAHELAAGSREAAADATNVSERTETAAQRAVGAPAVLLRALGYRLLVGHGGRF